MLEDSKLGFTTRGLGIGFRVYESTVKGKGL